MNLKHLLAAMCCLISLIGCGNGQEEKHSDLFDYSKPVDMSAFLQAYDLYQQVEKQDKDSILHSKMKGMPKGETIYLFADTSFVLRAPEYADSQQPFLVTAEDFYNLCALTWNVWSNYEVWYRGHTAEMLCSDDDVKKGIEAISAHIIKDADMRQVAQNFKDSLLLLMNMEPEEWDEDVYVMDLIVPIYDIVERKMYKFYDGEETLFAAVDSVTEIAEALAMDKFQHYLDASQDDQVRVMLKELASCKNFDEQCSLWRNWTNCEKSIGDDDWIIAVGCALMESGNYSPILSDIWLTWRALVQGMYYGHSRTSSIPNHYYNNYRQMCYAACLKRIESHPDDIYAMFCATVLGNRTNMNRFGVNYLGNEAMVESTMMMPKRYPSDDEE